VTSDSPEPQPSPWRDRRFLVFASGNFANNVGEQIYNVALPLLVYNLTGSLAAMSVLVLLSNATLLLGPILGIIVDRFGARVLVVPGLLLQLAAAVLLNVFGLARHAPLWPLFVLGALVQVGGEAYRAGWMAGVATMFPRNPARSRGSLNTLFVVSRVVGPLVTAAALPVIGYLGLLWVNVGSFVAPILVWLAGVHPPRTAGAQPAVAPATAPAAARAAGSGRASGLSRLYQDLAEGWRIMRENPVVLRAELICLPLNFVATTGTIALVMFYLRSHWHLSGQAVSTIVAATNLGALLGVILVAERRRFRLRRTLTICAVGMSGLLLAMAAPALPVFVGCLVLFYLLRQSMASASILVVFNYLPAHVIGRASGITDLIEGVPIISAPLIIPLLASRVGAAGTFALLGLTASISVGWLVISRAHWHGEQTRSRVPAVRTLVPDDSHTEIQETLCAPSRCPRSVRATPPRSHAWPSGPTPDAWPRPPTTARSSSGTPGIPRGSARSAL
jgi:MFS family permease